MKKIILASILALITSVFSLYPQAEPEQAIASLSTDDGHLTVRNGKDRDVWLNVDATAVAIGGEEALSIAKWIKVGEIGVYKNSPHVVFRRSADWLTVTLTPKEGASKTVRIRNQVAPQLADALATGRENTRKKP